MFSVFSNIILQTVSWIKAPKIMLSLRYDKNMKIVVFHSSFLCPRSRNLASNSKNIYALRTTTICFVYSLFTSLFI